MALLLQPVPGVTVPTLNLPPVARTMPAANPLAEGSLPAAETENAGGFPAFAESFASEFETLLMAGSVEPGARSGRVRESAEDPEPDAEGGDPACCPAGMLPVPIVPLPSEPKPPVSLPETAASEETSLEQGESVAVGGDRPAAAAIVSGMTADNVRQLPEDLNFQALRAHSRTRGARQADLAFALRLRERPVSAAGDSALPKSAPASVQPSAEPVVESPTNPVQPRTATALGQAPSTEASGEAPAPKSGAEVPAPPDGERSTRTKSEELTPESRPGEPAEAPRAARRSEPATREIKPVDAMAAPFEVASQKTEAAPGRPQVAAAGAPQQARSIELPVPEQTGVEPVRDLTLNVPVETERTGVEQDVAVRFVERGGEVYVAVRTDDADLARRLRSDLNGLASSLDERGYQAESWRPGAGAAASSGDEHLPDRHSQSSGENARHEYESRGEDRRQSRNRPSWLDALEQQEGDKA